jgi:hypothetical protein
MTSTVSAFDHFDGSYSVGRPPRKTSRPTQDDPPAMSTRQAEVFGRPPTAEDAICRVLATFES